MGLGHGPRGGGGCGSSLEIHVGHAFCCFVVWNWITRSQVKSTGDPVTPVSCTVALRGEGKLGQTAWLVTEMTKLFIEVSILPERQTQTVTSNTCPALLATTYVRLFGACCEVEWNLVSIAIYHQLKARKKIVHSSFCQYSRSLQFRFRYRFCFSESPVSQVLAMLSRCRDESSSSIANRSGWNQPTFLLFIMLACISYVESLLLASLSIPTISCKKATGVKSMQMWNSFGLKTFERCSHS